MNTPDRFAPVKYIPFDRPGHTRVANRSYSVKKDEISPKSNNLTLNAGQKLFAGTNYFWVSIRMKSGISLNDKITAAITSVTIDGKEAVVKSISPVGIEHRMGVGVRHAGDDNSA